MQMHGVFLSPSRLRLEKSYKSYFLFNKNTASSMPAKIIKNKTMNIFGADALLSLSIADKYPNLVADV